MGFSGCCFRSREPFHLSYASIGRKRGFLPSIRPYRKGMPVQQAMSIIEEGKGTQWDPYYATLFLEAMKDREWEKALG